MRWLAIANPAAGRTREADRMLALLHGLRGVNAEIVRTARPGDATRFAREAVAFDGVIAVGGDGTIAEILQGLDLQRQQLAVLPAGHGNSLARDLGVATAAHALEALQRGGRRPIDLMNVAIDAAGGRVVHRLCASTVALGYVAEIVEFGRRRLPRLGHMAYLVAAMAVVPRFFEARVTNGRAGLPPTRYTGLVVSNTRHLANFRALPDADPRDGLLDVMEQCCHWPRQLLYNLAVFANSRACGPLSLRQVAAECIELAEPRTLMADGELLEGVVRVAVECRPGAVICVAGSR